MLSPCAEQPPLTFRLLGFALAASAGIAIGAPDDLVAVTPGVVTPMEMDPCHGSDAVVPPIITAGGMIAVVEVLSRVDECTDVGGEHYVLRIVDGTNRIALAGGPGQRLSLVPPLEARTHFSRFMVAELEPIDPDDQTHIGGCLGYLPLRDAVAVARRLVVTGTVADSHLHYNTLVIATLDNARRVFEQIAKTGIPTAKPGGFGPQRIDIPRPPKTPR